ncbi:MAG: hypothetical protein AAGF84_09515 [Planctomycetota bacterium]
MFRKLVLILVFLCATAVHDAGATVLAAQDFEQPATGWAYTLDPNPQAFSPIFSHFGITDGLGAFTFGSGDFLAVRNAGDSANPHGDAVYIRFADISLTGHTDVELRFDYTARDFDPGESLGYEVFLDGFGQGDTVLVAGQAGRSDIAGTVNLPLPDAADTVSLVLRVSQKGSGDYAGFDNLAVVATPEPGAITVLVGLSALAVRRRQDARDSNPVEN